MLPGSAVPPAAPGPLRLQGRRLLAANAVMALVFALAGLLSFNLSSVHGSVAMVWPPAGLGLAALVLFGWPMLAGCAVGAFAFELWIGSTPLAMLAVVSAELAGLAAGYGLVLRLAPACDPSRLRDVLVIAFGASLALALASGLIGPVGLALAGEVQWKDLGLVTALWLPGATLGVLVFAPLVLAWRGGIAEPSGRRQALLAAVPAALTLVLCWLVFSGRLGGAVGHPSVAYLVMPFVVWTAIMAGPRTLTAVLLGCLGFALWGWAARTGPLVAPDPVTAYLLSHLFATFCSISGLLVHALVAEARAGERHAREAEQAVEASRRFLDAMLNAIPGPVLVKDEQLRYESVNAAFLEFFDRPAHELVGRSDADFFPPEMVAFLKDTDRRALEGEVVQYEREYAFPTHRRWMMVRKQRLDSPDGRHLVILQLTDVSERRAAEEALRRSEQRFRTVAELSSDWYWETDARLRLSYVSGDGAGRQPFAAESVLGRTRQELEMDFVPESMREPHLQLLERHEPYRDLLLRVRASGRLILVSAEPMFDADGAFTGYRGVARDVTALHAVRRELDDQRQFLDTLLGALPTAVSVKDENHRFVLVNDAFCAFAGVPRERLIGADDRVFLGPEDARRAWDADDQALEAPAPVLYEHLYRLSDGERWMQVRKSRVLRPDGSRLVISALNDISGLKAAERQLRDSERRFRDFAESASEYVWESDVDGRLTYVSQRVEEVLQRSAESLRGLTVTDVTPPGEYERMLEWIRANGRPDGSFRDMEHRILRADGEVLWVRVSAVRMLDEQGRHTGWRGTSRDITDRKSAEERISYLATRDALTGLPNRVLFNDRLEQALVNARRKGDSVALMFLDLDRFKNVNDSLGHHVGDLMLKEVALRMQACLRKGDTLSRLGGDEFVVTLEGLQHAEDAAQVAQKVIASLGRPMEVGGHTLSTSCSIGIAIFPGDADDPPSLMKNADTAMYHAKERGRRNFQFFSREMNIRAVERHALETALRVALDREQFELAWQPRVDIATGRVAAVEALLRWRHPDKGLLAPGSFIEVAEETGLIEPIGQWVLRSACTQAQRWSEDGHPPVRVSVNISARQFNNPREFSRSVSRLLSSTSLDPDRLELEMTESVLLQNADENIAALRRLSKLGVHVAVDDFGTGYSSLSYLKQLPINTLKIDRSFVRDLEADKDSEVIVATIIAMAHSLKLRVTAEGVENLAQLSTLKRLGCDEYQGYLFSRPVPAREFTLRFLAPRELNFGS